MWDLAYLITCASSPNPSALEYVLDNCGFEEDSSQQPLIKVKGAEKDFALMLLFVLMRHIAIADVLPGEGSLCVCSYACVHAYVD